MDRLIPFLRASNFYDLEKVCGSSWKERLLIVQAYRICKERDYVSEMVFLLGRMGNNKQALMLIIERLGDVQRVSLGVASLQPVADDTRQSISHRSKATKTCGKIF